MVRKELVFSALRDLTAELSESTAKTFRGFDAETVAERIGMHRSNVSRELNLLTQEGRAVKILGRPVYYFEKKGLEMLLGITLPDEPIIRDSIADVTKKTQDTEAPVLSLDTIIGAEGSLRTAVQQAKASVLYPSGGLNILLTGSTGTGKTTFAELIYLFAKEQGCLNQQSKFVIFNCSEYADNPQLLLSHLFGHVKGAFTGADTEKRGLVEEAEDGVLLLDEIHRLGPEGQEMLFLLIDKGNYRKLGESEALRKANVMIIAATTEDPSSHLLKTFVRRFPMIIRLPSLQERSAKERFMLIRDFFLLEAKKIENRIKVEKDVIQTLLSYNCPGNVGQLKADIQLLCAKGFLDYITGEESEVYIDATLLPRHMADAVQNGNESIIAEVEDDIYTFGCDEGEGTPDAHSNRAGNNHYDRIYSKYRRLLCSGKDLIEIQTEIQKVAEEYIQSLFRQSGACHDSPSKQDIYKVVSPAIYEAVSEAVSMHVENAARHTDMAIALSLHIEAAERRKSRMVNVNGDIRFQTADLREGINKEQMECAARIVASLEKRLPSYSAISDANFIYMLLTRNSGKTEETESKAENNIAPASLLLPETDSSSYVYEEERLLNLLSNSTVFIDPAKAYNAALVCFRDICESIPEKRRKSMEVRFLLHVACMLERIIQKTPLEYHGLEDIKKERSLEFARLRSAVKELEHRFCIEIPDSEIGFLIDLVYTL